MATKTYTETEIRDAEAIALIAKKQLETSRIFKQPRMTEILDTEDVYRFKLRPSLQGRLNVPFDGVVLSGFVDTWVAENNKSVYMEFEDPSGANLRAQKKMKAAWERDSKKMRLKSKELQLRHLAAISGRAIAKYYAESDPKYCPYFQVVDYLDFHCEPNGGGHLDDHYFHWQENIFRGKEDLEAGAKNGWYNDVQVKKVIDTYSSVDFKKNVDTFNNKNSRYMSLGLDMESNNYVGDTLYNLVEGDTFYKGKKYHVIWDANTSIWLRCVPLIEDFEDDMTPFISFAAPKSDAFNFWNQGPADKIKPIAEAIRLNLNEILNNNRKRNWDMKAVDINMFPDLRKLDWRQDGIVHANVPLNASIQQGVYRFETPELTGAINLNQYLDNMTGVKLGITSQTEGSGPATRLGIYQGNAMQVSKRMQLSSDAVAEFHEDLGKRYDWGLWTHASDKDMVRLISADGVGWEALTKQDLDPEYIVIVRTYDDEEMKNSDLVRAQIEAMGSVERDPNQLKMIRNFQAYVEEKFKLAGMSEEKIRKFFNPGETDDIISEAKKAIEIVLLGKNVKPNWGATTEFLQYISDWILNHSDEMKPEQKKRLEVYFDQHVLIAMKNAEQKQFRDEQTLKMKQANAMLENPKTSPMAVIGKTDTIPPVPVDNSIPQT